MVVVFGAVGKALQFLTGNFAEAISGVAKFDQGLANIRAITAASVDSVDRLSASIVSLAVTTPFAPEEIANAFTKLGQAGFTAAEATEAIGAVARLSIASLSDMESSVKLLTSAIRAFKLETSESAEVVDIMISAVNRSKLTVEGLNISMNFAAPAANAANLSVRDLTAAMGTMADAGIKASTQGTGLRQTMAALVSPTDKFRRVLDRLNLDVKDLNPLYNDFGDILLRLRDAGFSAADAFQGLERRTGATVLQLVNSADRFNSLRDGMDGAGAAALAAEAQMSGFEQTLKRITQEFRAIFLTEEIQKRLKGFLKILQITVRAIRDLASAISSSSKGLKTFLYLLTGILAGRVLLSVTMGLLAMKAAMAAFISAMTTGVVVGGTMVAALQTFLAALPITSILIFVSALAALAVGFFEAENAAEEFNVTSTQIRNNIDASKDSVTLLSDEFSKLAEVTKQAGQLNVSRDTLLGFTGEGFRLDEELEAIDKYIKVMNGGDFEEAKQNLIGTLNASGSTNLAKSLETAKELSDVIRITSAFEGAAEAERLNAIKLITTARADDFATEEERAEFARKLRVGDLDLEVELLTTNQQQLDVAKENNRKVREELKQHDRKAKIDLENLVRERERVQILRAAAEERRDAAQKRADGYKKDSWAHEQALKRVQKQQRIVDGFEQQRRTNLQKINDVETNRAKNDELRAGARAAVHAAELTGLHDLDMMYASLTTTVAAYHDTVDGPLGGLGGPTQKQLKNAERALPLIEAAQATRDFIKGLITAGDASKKLTEDQNVLATALGRGESSVAKYLADMEKLRAAEATRLDNAIDATITIKAKLREEIDAYELLGRNLNRAGRRALAAARQQEEAADRRIDGLRNEIAALGELKVQNDVLNRQLQIALELHQSQLRILQQKHVLDQQQLAIKKELAQSAREEVEIEQAKAQLNLDLNDKKRLANLEAIANVRELLNKIEDVAGSSEQIEKHNAQIKKLEEANEVLGRQRPVLERLLELAGNYEKMWAKIGRTINDSIADSVHAVVTGSMTMKDALRSVGDAFKDGFNDALKQSIKDKIKNFDIPFEKNISGVMGDAFGKGGIMDNAFGRGLKNIATKGVHLLGGGAGSIAEGTGGSIVEGTGAFGGGLAGALGSAIFGGVGGYAIGQGITGSAEGGIGGSIGGIAGVGIASTLGGATALTGIVGPIIAQLTGMLGTGAFTTALAGLVLPGIGLIIGSVLGSLIGGLFASKKSALDLFLEGAAGAATGPLAAAGVDGLNTATFASEGGVNKGLDSLGIDKKNSVAGLTKELAKQTIHADLLVKSLSAYAIVLADGAQKVDKMKAATTLLNAQLLALINSDGGLDGLDIEIFLSAMQAQLGSLASVFDKVTAEYERLSEKSALTANNMLLMSDAVEGAALVFSNQFPQGIDVAAKALRAFTEDGKIDVEELAEAVEQITSKVAEGATSLAKAGFDALANGGNFAAAQDAFAKESSNFLRDAIQASFAQALSASFLQQGLLTPMLDIMSEMAISLQSGSIDFEEFGAKIRAAVGGAIPQMQAMNLAFEEMNRQMARVTGLPIELLTGIFTGSGTNEGDSTTPRGFQEGSFEVSSPQESFEARFANLGVQGTPFAGERDFLTGAGSVDRDIVSHATDFADDGAAVLEEARQAVFDILIQGTIALLVTQPTFAYYGDKPERVDGPIRSSNKSKEVADELAQGGKVINRDIFKAFGTQSDDNFNVAVSGSIEEGLRFHVGSGAQTNTPGFTAIELDSTGGAGVGQYGNVTRIEDALSGVEAFNESSAASDANRDLLRRVFEDEIEGGTSLEDIIRDATPEELQEAIDEYIAERKEIIQEAFKDLAESVSNVDQFLALFSQSLDALDAGALTAEQQKDITESGFASFIKSLPGDLQLSTEAAEELLKRFKDLNGDIDVDAIRAFSKGINDAFNAVSSSLKTGILEAIKNKDVDKGVKAFGDALKTSLGNAIIDAMLENFTNQIFDQALAGVFESLALGEEVNPAEIAAEVGSIIDASGPVMEEIIALLEASGLLIDGAASALDEVANTWRDILLEVEDTRRRITFAGDEKGNAADQFASDQSKLAEALAAFRDTGNTPEEKAAAAKELLALTNQTFDSGASLGEFDADFQRTGVGFQNLQAELLAILDEVEDTGTQVITDQDYYAQQVELLKGVDESLQGLLEVTADSSKTMIDELQALNGSLQASVGSGTIGSFFETIQDISTVNEIGDIIVQIDGAEFSGEEGAELAESIVTEIGRQINFGELSAEVRKHTGDRS